MPARYVGIRDSLVKKGTSLAEAKTHAAKIFDATRKPGVAPVARGEDHPNRVGVKKAKG